ncbi:mevalonate kinase, partial [Streptococcus pyogenes]
GCMIALADTKEMAETISHKLQEEGAVNTWIQML